MGRLLGVAILAAAAAACSTPPVDDASWPAGIPTKSYYARAYDQDKRNQQLQTREDYFVWAIRFYQGYALAPGWTKVEKDLSKDLADEQYVLLLPKLGYVGQLMSAEWAKHNQVRRINTDMLALWGKVLRKSKSEGRLDGTVDRLIGDVHSLLTGELDSKSIGTERYSDLLGMGYGK